MKVTLNLEIEPGSAHVASFYLSGALRAVATELTSRHQKNLDGLPPSIELENCKARIMVTG